jgi:hypothetical protein
LHLELLGDRLVAQRRGHDLVETGDDRIRRGSGREHAEPVDQLIALELGGGLGERHDVGELRHALARGHRNSAQPAVLHQRQRSRETGKAHGDGAGRDVGDRRRRAAIGHVQDVGAGHRIHQLAGELLRVADAGGGKRELATMGARIGNELGGGPHRRIGRDHHHARHHAHERDRSELAQRVVAHLVPVEMLVDRDLARGRHQQREAVRRRLGNRSRGDHRARAGAVLDDDGLPERRLHRLAQHARDNVDPAASGIADENADRPVRIGALCARKARARDQREPGACNDVTSGRHGSVSCASEQRRRT